MPPGTTASRWKTPRCLRLSTFTTTADTLSCDEDAEESCTGSRCVCIHVPVGATFGVSLFNRNRGYRNQLIFESGYRHTPSVHMVSHHKTWFLLHQSSYYSRLNTSRPKTSVLTALISTFPYMVIRRWCQITSRASNKAECRKTLRVWHSTVQRFQSM